MAEGGQMRPFCGASRAHEPDCQYFADGSGPVQQFDDMAADPESAPTAAPAPAPQKFDDMVADPGTESAAPTQQFDDLVEDPPASALPPGTKFDDLVEDRDYGTTGQQILAGIEGAAAGVAPGVAQFAEHHLLGEPYEAIAGRADANPWTHGLAETGAIAASTLAGVGVPGRIAQGAAFAAKAAEAAGLRAVGSKVLSSALSSGLLAGGDEASKWITGQGDPNEAVGAKLVRMGITGMLGGIFSGVGSKVSKGLSKLAESNLGERAEFFLHGLGAASKAGTPEARAALNEGTEGLSTAAAKGYASGQKAFDAMTTKLVPGTLGATAEAARGYKEDGVYGAGKGLVKGALEGVAFGLLGKGVAKTMGAAVTPAAVFALTHGGRYMLGAMDHAADIMAGSDALHKGVDALVRGSAQQAAGAYGSPKLRNKINEYIEGGHIHQGVSDEMQSEEPAVGFAKGGPAEHPTEGQSDRHDAVAAVYPEQHLLLQAAKARMTNYLNGLKPQKNAPKLAFDEEPDTRDQQRSYNKALDLAATPLGILKEVHDGTIEPEHVQHFNALHPEVGGLLQKKITERLTQAQVNGERPSFKTRQGLSLLMGTPLSGELTPAGIQAAQSVFAAKSSPAPSQTGPAPKKNTSKLSKSSQAYLTSSQALDRRGQKV